MALPSGEASQAEHSRLQHLRRQVTGWIISHLVSSIVGFLGLCWVLFSWLAYRAERGANGANITTFGDSLWWGLVTFLTVGYGDRFPVTIEGRIWAGLLMLVGVAGVAVITSKIASYFLEQVLREGRGAVKTDKLKDHLVVCGWKEDMHEVLTHILDFNPDLEPEDLVVVANSSPEAIEAVRQNARLRNVQFIVGDYVQEVNLKRAAPERARKVMILADRTPSPAGAIPSRTEVDARTIMAAMTLNSLHRGTLVTAEILDPKMDQYLKLASVNEIIYSREYSRLLLGNASGGTGVANIVFDLLDPRTPTWITTRPVPESLLGARYARFKEWFEKEHPEDVVIGVLENTGNVHTIKELALRQAQKTPDMNRLVQNLKAVKELRCNQPVFNPGPEYVVPEGSMAIVIETRGRTGHDETRGRTGHDEARGRT